MCAIVGIVNIAERTPITEGDISGMLAQLRHRGPDEFGIYYDGYAGLGNARLSIIDLSGGRQPISNEDGSMWIVFNGEIFNYVELRPQLEARGHRFATSSDTEVLLHMFEEFGPECLEQLNGQFAFAVWNTRDRSLFLARDRLGVRPCFYSQHDGRFLFASEIKGILAAGAPAEIDAVALDQIFTYWCPLSPRTAFKRIQEIPPGHYAYLRNGNLSIKRYWDLDFPDREEAPASSADHDDNAKETLAELLIDATKVRLRADVPVGAYLSGGLDSSVIASIVRHFTGNHLDTFSIAFEDDTFDESAWQLRMARALGTDHHVVRATHADIGRIFPEVIWHAEVPLLRTSPAPMFMLSKLVRKTGYKVVLTGEGADEFLAGYDIFKEAKVRRFWAKRPESRFRPMLLGRLYPDIKGLATNRLPLLAAFFRNGLEDVCSPFYSHAIRWRNGERIKRFFSDEMRSVAQANQVQENAPLVPERMRRWDPLAQAQFLEISIFLSQYLLSSQGDRMAMANSIEGRFPFLDYRVVDYCNALSPECKLHGLIEKYILKQVGRKWLPAEIWQRPKRPYRAPIHRAFVNPATAGYVEDLLSPTKIAATGYFRAPLVTQLLAKTWNGLPLGETDDMALAGIISTQLLHHHFIENFRPRAQLTDLDVVKVCSGVPAAVHSR